MENERRTTTKPKDLACLGSYVGKTVFMEIRGETPQIPERREIYLSGKLIAVDEYSSEKTATIQIPLSHFATLSETPIVIDREPQQKP